MGDEPVLVKEVAANFESWDAYEKKIEFHVGPSGFSLATIDHGAWIKKVGFAFTLARIAGALTVTNNIRRVRGKIVLRVKEDQPADA